MKTFITTLVLVAAFLFVTNANATSWYVNDNSLTGDVYTTAVGNDGNAGTAAAPFATVQHAFSTASAGDTIYVDAGTFIFTSVTQFNKLITLIGNTTIGTTIFNYQNPGQFDYAFQFSVRNSEAKNITFERTWTSSPPSTPEAYVYLTEVTAHKITFDGCTFLDGRTAIGYDIGDSLLVQNSIFHGDRLSRTIEISVNGGMTFLNNTFNDRNGVKGTFDFENEGVEYGTFTGNSFNLANTPGYNNNLYVFGLFGQIGPGNLVITNNTFTANSLPANSRAIGFGNDPPYTYDMTKVTILNNSFTGGYPCFIKNSVPSGAYVPVTCNWFGSNVKATVAAKMVGNVTYIPYLDNGTDTQPSTPGFQPGGSCSGTCPLVITSVSTTNVSCYGGSNGSLIAHTSGAISPSYSWNSAPVQTTDTATGLGVGTYAVTVSDVNGCSATSSSYAITQPPAIIFKTFQDNVSACDNTTNSGVIYVKESGIGSMAYSKNNGSTFQGSPVFTELTAGTYIVKVKDAGGCISPSAAVTITSYNPINVTTSVIAATSAAASNGRIAVIANGGAGYYNYSDNGGTSYQSSNLFNTLSHGSYNIRVTDVNGCLSNIVIATVGP